MSMDVRMQRQSVGEKIGAGAGQDAVHEDRRRRRAGRGRPSAIARSRAASPGGSVTMKSLLRAAGSPSARRP